MSACERCRDRAHPGRECEPMRGLKTSKEERAALRDTITETFPDHGSLLQRRDRQCLNLLDDLDTLEAENAALREVLASQAEMIESDVSAADQHGKGGQQAGVPRLVVTPPSVRNYLRRIARELREAMEKDQ